MLFVFIAQRALLLMRTTGFFKVLLFAHNYSNLLLAYCHDYYNLHL